VNVQIVRVQKNRYGKEVLSSAVFKLEKPGSPPIKLIGEIGMGPFTYYRGLEQKLQASGRLFAGYVALKDDHPHITGSGFYARKLAHVRRSLQLRQDLARSVGLVTRHDIGIAPSDVKITNVDYQGVCSAARLMKWTEATALAWDNWQTSNALEADADREFRLVERARNYFRNLVALNNENNQVRATSLHTEWNLQIRACVRDAAHHRQGAHQIVGVDHLATLVQLMEADGYKLMGDVDWAECLDLRGWQA
jgi:hypothetical protein